MQQILTLDPKELRRRARREGRDAALAMSARHANPYRKGARWLDLRREWFDAYDEALNKLAQNQNRLIQKEPLKQRGKLR